MWWGTCTWIVLRCLFWLSHLWWNLRRVMLINSWQSHFLITYSHDNRISKQTIYSFAQRTGGWELTLIFGNDYDVRSSIIYLLLIKMEDTGEYPKPRRMRRTIRNTHQKKWQQTNRIDVIHFESVCRLPNVYRIHSYRPHKIRYLFHRQMYSIEQTLTHTHTQANKH